MIVSFLFCCCCLISFLILRVEIGFKVDVILFNNRIEEGFVSVLVSDSCCCCLFDKFLVFLFNSFGGSFVREVSFLGEYSWDW